ncbi:hypothetical protein [Myroides odoratus]|uniref:hypothetical protein n=1 Tax=Myroides odoratus TaxID=256 RepID=UPI00076608F2|nr:hypothetical protein [Myroides odoratus]
MEWSKIDQEWKKQLDERSIAPSARAWDQLTKQLDDRDKKKKRSALTLGIGIAACLVVSGIMGLIFWKTEQRIPANPTDSPATEQYMVVEDTGTEETLEQRTQVEPIRQNSVVHQKEVMKKGHLEQLVQVEHSIQITPTPKREKMDSLTIDEIWVNKPQRKVMVDSNHLLKQVEGEIEVEYRETKLKKIIDTTKKAVVDISESRYEK